MHVYVYVCICMYMYMHMYMYVCICMFVYVCVCICAYIEWQQPILTTIAGAKPAGQFMGDERNVVTELTL